MRFNPLALSAFFLFLTAGVTAGATCFAADEGQEPARVIRPITEKYDDRHRQFQCVPTLCVVDDQRIWASWYAGGIGEGPDNYILVATSGDGGLTWSKPLFAIDPAGPARAFDEILWTDPNGRVWLFWGQNIQGKTPVGQWEIHTDNPQDGEKAVWTQPRRICDGVMLNKPIVDSGGRWLYPIQIPSMQKYPQGAAVYVSADGGETVELLSFGTRPDQSIQGADEHNLVERKDGSLWLTNRLKINGIGETTSRDGGRTWSEFKIYDEKHTISRFFIRRLRSGNLLMVRHGEPNEYCARTRLTAFLSDDDGETWRGGLMIEPRFRCSYPDGDQAPDGTIYLTYDRNRALEREIFCAKITEDDILAGRLVSPQSRLNIIINQPTDKFETGWESSVRHINSDGTPGAYWEAEKVFEVIQEIERGERPPIKCL